MTSVADICNQAISHCGTRSKIASIDEQSREALACKTHFDQCRDSTLSGCDWNFARMTATLALLSIPIPVGQTVAPTSNVDRWCYEYALPIDCIRVRRINDTPMLLIPMGWYELAADKDSLNSPINVLFTNARVAKIIYTALVTDFTRWGDSATDAMAYGLAARICYELTGKSDRSKELFQLWQGMLSSAQAENANSNPSVAPTYVPEALSARGFDDGLAEQGQTWQRSLG